MKSCPIEMAVSVRRSVTSLRAAGAIIAAALAACLLGCASTSVPSSSLVAPTPIFVIPAARSGTWLAGASRIAITPPSSLGHIMLAGYGIDRPARGIHDDLWARCAAITGPDGARLVIVSLDLIGFLYADAQEIIRRAAAFTDASVVVTSTHTHSGPDTIGIFGSSLIGGMPLRSGRNDDYVSFVINQSVACIGDALESQQPATLHVAQHTLPGLSRNLRQPDLRDDTSTVLHAAGEDGRTIFFLQNFGVHPEIHMGNDVSADFLHYWYGFTEATHGGVAIFLNGGLGALVAPQVPNLYTVDEQPNQATAQYRGRRYRAEVRDAWGTAEWFARRMHRRTQRAARFEPIPPEPLVYRKRALRVELRNSAFWAAYILGLLSRPDYRHPHVSSRSGELWRELTDGLLPGNRFRPGSIATEVGYARIGGVGIAFLPGETPPSLSLALRARLARRHPHTMIVSLANDELGYLLSHHEAGDPLYEYERTMCVNPDIGNILRGELEQLIAENEP